MADRTEVVSIEVTKELLKKIDSCLNEIEEEFNQEIEISVNDRLKNEPTKGSFWWKKPLTRKEVKDIVMHGENFDMYPDSYFALMSKGAKEAGLERIKNTFSNVPLPQTINVSFSTFNRLFKQGD